MCQVLLFLIRKGLVLSFQIPERNLALAARNLDFLGSRRSKIDDHSYTCMFTCRCQLRLRGREHFTFTSSIHCLLNLVIDVTGCLLIVILKIKHKGKTPFLIVKEKTMFLSLILDWHLQKNIVFEPITCVFSQETGRSEAARRQGPVRGSVVGGSALVDRSVTEKLARLVRGGGWVAFWRWDFFVLEMEG